MPIDAPPAIIEAAQAADAQLWPLLLAIAKYESGYTPEAIGDNGCSYGLLQFNTCGGLGAGHSPENLMDAGYNLRLGAQYIRAQTAAGASLYEALQPWSVRDRAWAQYQEWGGQGAAPVAGSGGGGRGLLLAALAVLVLWGLV